MNKKFLLGAAYFGISGAMVLLGMALDSLYRLPFEKLGDVATWMGAACTGAAFLGTLWIASEQVRFRDVQRREMAMLAAVAIEPRVRRARYTVSYVKASLKRSSKGGVYHEGLKRCLAKLNLLVTWNVVELTALAPLPNDCAKFLAQIPNQIQDVISDIQSCIEDVKYNDAEGINNSLNLLINLTQTVESKCSAAIAECVLAASMNSKFN